MSAFALLSSFVTGVLLGLLYFGSLWLVVRRLPEVGHPAAWLGISSVVRMAVALAGFFVAMQGQWQRLLVCLAGFVLVRLALTRALWPARATNHGEAGT